MDLRTDGSEGALETTRILTFVAVAYGVAWLVGLYIYLTGGLGGPARLVSGVPVSRALILLATGYMWAPAIANVAARLLTGEGWTDVRLRPRIRSAWPHWLAALFLPPVLVLLGVGVYFLALPGQYDPALSTLRNMPGVGAAAATFPGGVWGLLAVYLLQSVVVAALLNSLFTFGEEFGWRGYLLYKLLPLGGRRAAVLTGVVWGVWHWPIIAMGYNYGLDYPGAPWLGPVAMLWFTVVTGVVLAWLALRGGSVWPAVVGHATINGFGAAGVVFLRQGASPNPLLGPFATGVVVTLPWALVAGYLLWKPGALEPKAPPVSADERDGSDPSPAAAE
ncbi:MAG: CPBP family intramembrane glutamic endopeptidase [Haloferacaceae archaeon]